MADGYGQTGRDQDEAGETGGDGETYDPISNISC